MFLGKEGEEHGEGGGGVTGEEEMKRTSTSGSKCVGVRE